MPDAVAGDITSAMPYRTLVNIINFRRANLNDLPNIMEIIRQAQVYLRSLKIDQWQNNYPNIETIISDINKNLDSLAMIWTRLCDNGATRKSLLINIGGGVVTDIGAFAGATFKRGIRFLNVPTTLLSAVDAAVGGKTGINFNGFKKNN